MDIKDLEQIRKQLEEEYNKNCSKINDLNEKIRVIGTNSFETKAGFAILFSILAWIAAILLIPTIIKSGITSLNLVKLLCVGIPALIGIISEELFTRKLKCRDRLRKFSKSKTQKEKIEESTRYEIEKEKLESLNAVLRKGYDEISANENMIISLSENYNITKKVDDSKTVEETTTNIKNINAILEKQQHDINIATTKCVLKEKFLDVRDKFGKFFNIPMFGMEGSMFCMIIYYTPMIYMKNFQNIQSQANLIEALAPFVLGGLAYGGYCIKRKRDYTFVFKTLNKELGDNAISEFIDYEADKQIDKDLENIIRDTSVVKVQLETEKQKLKNIISISNSKELMKSENNNIFVHSAELVSGEKLQPNDKFSDEKLESYEKLLESPITEEVQGPVLVKKMTQPNRKSNKK